MKPVAKERCKCGENPLWHPDENRLYWVDVDTGEMFVYDPATDKSKQVYHSDVIGGMTLHHDGKLLLFLEGGAIALWDGKSLKTQLWGILEEKDSRFNDVIADPEGRVYAGTMPTGEQGGRLYRYDPDGKLTVLLEDAGQPNGMAFSPDLQYLYVTDTRSRRIYRFRYERSSGSLSEQKTLVQFGDEDRGNPDGLTVDADGNLWSALWDGAGIMRFSPDGERLGRVDFPVVNVTCLTFAGPDFDHAYVTTAGGGEPADAGGVFRIKTDVKGRAEFRSGKPS